jgi:ADP-ribosyl-[dinitrogen reductase] hydrolase
MKPPLPNSYWVEPGRLLAGEHPAGNDAASTRERIDVLVAAGVRAFIDLTEPHELEPYRALLSADVGYENFPIPDHALPRSPQQMREVQVALERAMGATGVVYVHCRAGIGRTGVTIGCYLREQGESPQGAMVELNRLWQQNARAARWPSIPETQEQEDYVRGWQPHPIDVRAGTADSGLHRLAVRPMQRYRGCLLGMAIGDALASASGVAPAAWTDDTGMALCVAQSLLAQGGFDGRDQLERYRDWARDPQAAGAAATATLRPVVRNVLSRAVWNRVAVLGSHDPTHQDPSPLTRSASTALFAAGRTRVAGALAADTARVTHQSPVLVDACRLFSMMVCVALSASSRAAVLNAAAQAGALPLREEVRQMAVDWQGPQTGRRKPYQAVLGTLDRAVRCFARTRSLADGFKRALDSTTADRDAVCASFGALAGAYYGEAAIGQELRSRVAGLAQVERIADALYQQGSAARGVVA